MGRTLRIIPAGLVLALSLGLGGCESIDFDNPFVKQKRLEGDRKAVFPEGVPGVPQGVPREYVKGQQPQAEAEPAVAAAPEAEKPKPKPKARPKRVAAPTEPAPSRLTVAPSGGSQQQAAPRPSEQPSQAPASSQQAPWPQQQGQPATAWPSSPPQSGTFTR